ncbi:MAG: 6-phosphofructokinase [Candidatus Shikimatogenerans bostrichidophilus]|nr:MAG: 6-phosphofructokinase [Candidatus Shikimatogenerans bostrichidophilus]
MYPLIKKIGIITSGGDSPGMNSAIKTIVNVATTYNIPCVGYKYGYDGLIFNKYIKLLNNNVNNIINIGGTIIGSGRSKLFLTYKGRQQAYSNLRKNKIDGLIIIGGNGSFKGINLFNKEYNFPIIGIPGTIDNDINGTDITLGYDTALNAIIKSIEKISVIAKSNKRIFIIEVMGRNTSHLAFNSGITLNALYIIYNNKYSIDHIKDLLKKRSLKSYIIIVAENNIIGSASKLIYNKLKNKIKTFEFRRTILGYIQRGGSPSYNDRMLGIKFGLNSFYKLINYKKNLVIGQINNKCVNIPFNIAILKKKNKYYKYKKYNFY